MKRGGAWEAQLDRLHDRYRRDRRAAIFRAHPPVGIIADHGKRFTGFWAGDGPPDFVGLLYESGRGVSFDAKDCRGRRWTFQHLPRHQARDLEAVHLAGGVAFIALRIRGQGVALPWAELGPLYWSWRNKAPGSVASVTGAEPWACPFDVAGDGWLDALGT